MRLPMYPLVGRERYGNPEVPSLVDRLIADAGATFDTAPVAWRVDDYVTDAMKGGWPDTWRASGEPSRLRWLGTYVDTLATREVAGAAVPRDLRKLRRYLQALAANTGGVPTHKLLYDAAGITRVTADAYDDLLDTLMITERLPAWAGSRIARLVKLPKRHLIDPALLRGVMPFDVRKIMRDADLLGRVLDTYVAAQLRAECSVSTARPELLHLRDTNGQREVDLVIETGDGRVIGVEVKATSSPGRDDARHLAWLGERLGDDFKLGIVAHTGPRVLRLGERLVAVPIARLWSPVGEVEPGPVRPEAPVNPRSSR
jgi:hypothetical protein